MDKAALRLGDNNTVNFERCFIFLTSNLGAQNMMNQMQAMGQGQGQGMPQAGRNGRDPLGRERNANGEGPDFGGTTKVPEEIDIQRAREILEEIRRRLGTGGAPALERDYLERLLGIR